MGQAIRPFLVGPCYAAQFLTIAPPLLRRPPGARDFGAAEAYFPFIGLALGTLLALIDAGLTVVLSPTVRDVVLVATQAALTGALHLDGLIDTFDGLFGARDPESRLAVMRDPRAGAYGIVAVVCLLFLKVAALGALTGPIRPIALLLGPCLGRWAIVQATWTFPYARPQGLGRAFKDGIRGLHVFMAGSSALAVGWMLAGLTGAAMLVCVILFVQGAGQFTAARLGGLTGDTYGAVCEIVETSVWLALGIPLLAATLTLATPAALP